MQADTHEVTAAALFERLPGLYVHPDRTREWLPELPAEIGLSLLKCERLIPRLSAVITQHYALTALKADGGLDLSIGMLSFNSLTQVSLLAGAIFNARQIRMLISKPAIAALFPGMGDWAHSYVMAQVEMAPPSGDITEGTPPTAEIMARDGQLCFRAWLGELSAPAAQRIALKFPKDFETGPLPPEFEAYGPGILRAAGRGVLDHDL
jgi:hypothetical protein